MKLTLIYRICLSRFIVAVILVIFSYSCFSTLAASNNMPHSKESSSDDTFTGKSTAEILDHAYRCFDLGMIEEHREVLEKLKSSKSDMSPADKSRCLYGLALSYYVSGSYQLCLNNIFELLRQAKVDSLRHYDISARIMLAGTYIRFHSVSQADSVLKTAKAEFDKYKFNKDITRQLHHNYLLELSTIYAERGEWQKYIDTLKESDKYADNDKENQLRRKLDYGIYYMQTARPDLAEKYFESLRSEKDWSYDKSAALANYAQMLLNEKDYGRAIEISDEALDLLNGHRMDQMRSSLLLVKGLALNATGKSSLAVPLLEESREIRDSLFEWHTTNSVLGSAKEFERELYSYSYEKAKNNMRSAWIVAGCILVLLVVAIGCLLWYRHRNSRSITEFKKTKQQLDEIEQRHNDDMQDTLQDLSETKRRIVALTMKLSQVNDIVKTSLDDTTGQSDSERIAALREGMKHIDLNRSVWNTFDLLFEQTSPRFYDNLSRIHPDLTKGEKRMCAYIRVGLSSKEIATITNRSARTVETIRYRLKKKLNLPEGSSLTSYLTEFS